MSRIMDFLERNSSWGAPQGKWPWIVKYSVACVVLIVAFIIIFRHVLGLDVLSYTSQIGVAALLGIIGVIALSVALMAATFYSSRSGIDDEVRDAHDVGSEPRSKGSRTGDVAGEQDQP
jgi:protein-S-isoprenylcysteine O-methyltransferase Ste14